MVDEELEREARQLAEELARSGLKVLERQWRCPDELKLRVMAYAHRRRKQGRPLTEIAGRLGVGERTLRRWFQREWAEVRRERVEEGEGFRQVSIVSTDPEPGGVIREHEGLILTTPAGYRVEGLEVKSAAYLLRVLS